MSAPTRCELCGKPFRVEPKCNLPGYSTARYLVDVPGAGKAEACETCKRQLDDEEQRTIDTRYQVNRTRSMDRRGH